MRGFVVLVLALRVVTAGASDDETAAEGMAQAADPQVRDTTVWRALPIDLYIDLGGRVDTDDGNFELSIMNAFGRLR